MRKVLYTSAVVSVSATLLSVLFKLMHLQGADQLLMLGLGGLALIVLPLGGLYLYKKRR
ncbi:MAG: hypothetical protein O3C22_05130 [Bacteroidetes bacterium]|nr:hypothetical protein [Bacteroidota bacterium]MDA0943670.1 hypothetical protein [Bacteroidota bacterium]MDA1111549.1 hypothetical protein [Bacteroidota bacterium]